MKARTPVNKNRGDKASGMEARPRAPIKGKIR